MKKVIGILGLLMFASPGYAETDYLVKAKIYAGETLIGSPAMQVAPHKQAGAAISGSYDLTISITPVSENTASVNSQLIIGSQHLSPSMLVELDKETTVRINDKCLSILLSKVRS